MIENKLFRKVLIPKKEGYNGAFSILHNGTLWVLCRSPSILCSGEVVPVHAFSAYGVVEV